jgi:16S rRNA (adenine(1408)-N(1))-methyltransferase
VEIITGKHCQDISADELRARIAGYSSVHIDLGTGDGRFVLHTAHAYPVQSAIGIDACRDHLRDASRRAPANALFLIANALDLPPELAGLADAITINFPWGTLLMGLLAEDSPLLAQLARMARPGATLEVRLNGGALAEAGWTLGAGSQQVRRLAGLAGFRLATAHELVADDLRAFQSTWARRLAFGRDPRAHYLVGSHNAPAVEAAFADCGAGAARGILERPDVSDEKRLEETI